MEKENIVKIVANNERFWVIVKHIEGSIVTGIVDNQLIQKNTDYYYGAVRFLILSTIFFI